MSLLPPLSALAPAWPEITASSRLWSRWWWPGSAVDAPNLTRLLGEYRAAGIGGLEICPIYGAQGYESRYLDFLSPSWMAMLAVTAQASQRLGLGLDLTTGTGWPMGGPWIHPPHASEQMELHRYPVAAGCSLSVELPAGEVGSLRAFGPQGRAVDLAGSVTGRRLDWTAPPSDGPWKVYVLLARSPIQQVKRAAPGGAGAVVDPYSVTAIDAYLRPFSEALSRYHGPPPRAQFHDSFEYFGADWTNGLFEAFRRARGYDLRDALPAFAGDQGSDAQARVKRDYRATIAELHLAYVTRWAEWCRAHGSWAREQAHGSPANLEDVYAVADIPETEIMGPPSEDYAPMLAFASSAAHLTGRNLTSAESFTWRGEHFQVTLADLKPEADLLFLTGINHLFLHGIAYSPADVAWPGWLFYAAVDFGPEGGLWRDLPAFTAYVARCQSILQAGQPANDLLLYFPIEDFRQKPEGTVELLTTPGKWMAGSPFHAAAMELTRRGMSFDEVTDDLLLKASAQNGTIRFPASAANGYRAIVVPPCRLMPVETLRRLLDLARAGATVIFAGPLPEDVPGWGQWAKRRGELQQLLDALSWQAVAGSPEPAGRPAVRRAALGSGAIFVGQGLEGFSTALQLAGVPRESMADSGLRCIRRRRPDGFDYFVVNPTNRIWDGLIPLATAADSAAVLDPEDPQRIGLARLRHNASGQVEVQVRLETGQAIILRTRFKGTWKLPPWTSIAPVPSVRPVPVTGPWEVSFVAGGPVLPSHYTVTGLASWTERADPDTRRFAGTAVYRTSFDLDPAGAADWRLDLGRVAESARLRVNGHEAGVLWHPPYTAQIGAFLHAGSNVLEVEVTNLAANRIADLDRRGVQWKSFHEINFVDRNYQPFDASKWPLRASGLLGPVTLAPLSVDRRQ